MVREVGDELVVRAQRGDEAAWAELYGDHADRLVLWLHRLHHADPAADAEDVAAEAWLIAARRMAEFSGDRSEFAGWLFVIARNIWRSRYRTCRSRGTVPVAPHAFETVCLAEDDVAPAIASTDRARRLVARLPERESEVVTCLDLVGLDVATTCQALHMSAAAVRVAHHRGLLRLRRMLDQRGRAGLPPDVTPVPARDM